MMKRPVLFFVVMAVTGQADTVIFRNGARLDGIWMGSDAQNVRLMVNGAMQTYLKTDVSAVNFDPQSAPRSRGFPRATTIQCFQPPARSLLGVAYIKDASGALTPLEKTFGTQQGTGRGYSEIAGARAAVRIRAAQKPIFVVRLPNGADPGKFLLYPMETRNNTRRTFSSANSRDGYRTIPLNITKAAGASLYEYMPAQDLAPGEYTLSPSDSNDAYCFGID